MFPHNRIIEGDVFDQDSLRDAFLGQDIVYLNLSIAQSSRMKELQPEREGIQNILAAAMRVKIQRIAYLSSLIKNYQGMQGFDWWALRIKNDALQKVKSSGIPYSIFYPSTFMETFYNLVRGNTIYLVSGSRAPMWMIAADDYGRQISRAFEIATGNQEFVFQGLNPYTWDEAARIIIETNKKKKLKIRKAPMGLIKFLGNFSGKINYAGKILTALNNYPEKFESEDTWKQLGKPEITLAEFATGL
jgi:uncharacterized protein YbjT (DUF2867 family)